MITHDIFSATCPDKSVTVISISIESLLTHSERIKFQKGRYKFLLHFCHLLSFQKKTVTIIRSRKTSMVQKELWLAAECVKVLISFQN